MIKFKNRITRTMIGVAVMSSLIVTPAFAAPSVGELESQKAAAQSQVNSLQSELTGVIVKMDQLESEMADTSEKINQATVDLTAAEAKEAKQYADMKLRIQYMYEEGDNSFLESILTSTSFSEMLNKAEYVTNIHDQDRTMLKEYEETKTEVASLKSSLETKMQDLQTTQTEFDAQKSSLDNTIATKQAEVSDFEQQLAAAEAAAAAERAAAEVARQAAAARSVTSTRVNNTDSSSNTSSGSANNSNTSNNSAPGNTSTAQTIVNAAYSQIGVPYVWGGTSPGSGLDCSGLTQYCHRVAGISIPRTSGDQRDAGMLVTDPQPGDIAYSPGHVAIYIGNGQMIEAQQSGTNIMVSRVRASCYVRYW